MCTKCVGAKRAVGRVASSDGSAGSESHLSPTMNCSTTTGLSVISAYSSFDGGSSTNAAVPGMLVGRPSCGGS